MAENAVLFDVQNTIVKETKEVSQYYYEAIRSSYGLSIDNIMLADYEGHTVQETLAAILSKQGLTKSEIYARHEFFLEELPYAYYNVAGHDRAVLADGAKDILNRLSKKSDTIMGVATGQLERISKNLSERAGLKYEDYFKFGAYGDASEGMPKIIDVAISKAVRDYGIERRHISFICSSISSLRAAQSVGINAIGVIPDTASMKGLAATRADHIVKSLKGCERFIA